MSREPDIVQRLRDIAGEWADAEIREEAADEIERLRALLRRHQAAAKFRLSPACDLAVETCAALAGEEPKLISLEDEDDWPVLEACAEIERLREIGNATFIAMCAFRDNNDEEAFQDAIDALGTALRDFDDMDEYHDVRRNAAIEIERLRAALKPFAVPDKESLIDTLGHIGREEIAAARAALEQKL